MVLLFQRMWFRNFPLGKHSFELWMTDQLINNFWFQNSCALNCLEKYLKSTQRISTRFQEHHLQYTDDSPYKAMAGKSWWLVIIKEDNYRIIQVECLLKGRVHNVCFSTKIWSNMTVLYLFLSNAWLPSTLSCMSKQNSKMIKCTLQLTGRCFWWLNTERSCMLW